jgi:hypothetical protein
VGVDFEEETVDEEIVIALPEEGGMICCFATGVDGVGFAGRGLLLFSCWVLLFLETMTS